MSLIENALLSAVRFKLGRDLGMDSLIADIPVDGLREYTDIPYTNRAGKQLFMDILEPEVPAGTERPEAHPRLPGSASGISGERGGDR